MSDYQFPPSMWQQIEANLSARPQYLYPLSVYECPNGHELFYSRAGFGGVTSRCPDCQEQGISLRCDGEGHTWLRSARPVKP